MSQILHSSSPADTRALGQKLGAVLKPGDLVCLQGDLGAGKTTFTQGVAAGWGSIDEVSSPTFVLVNIYRREKDRNHLHHLDTYRIESAAEADELDLDSMLTQGPALVEWPERITESLPADRLWVTLAHENETHRYITLQAFGRRAEELLKALA